MGKVERLFIEALIKFTEAYGRGIAREEAESLIIPSDQPHLRQRPAYSRCFQRLDVRGMVVGKFEEDGVWRFWPSEKALKELVEGYSNGPDSN